MPMSLSNKIQFTRRMASSNFQFIEEQYYEKLCINGKDVFERIPDDKPVKIYIDADHNFYENFEDFRIGTANEILRMHKLYITQYFKEAVKIEPIYAVAESHSKRRIKGGKEVWGYSFHIVITNILATKQFQKEIVNTIIEGIKIDEKRKRLVSCDTLK